MSEASTKSKAELSKHLKGHVFGVIYDLTSRDGVNPSVSDLLPLTHISGVHLSRIVKGFVEDGLIAPVAGDGVTRYDVVIENEERFRLSDFCNRERLKDQACLYFYRDAVDGKRVPDGGLGMASILFEDLGDMATRSILDGLLFSRRIRVVRDSSNKFRCYVPTDSESRRWAERDRVIAPALGN